MRFVQQTFDHAVMQCVMTELATQHMHLAVWNVLFIHIINSLTVLLISWSRSEDTDDLSGRMNCTYFTLKSENYYYYYYYKKDAQTHISQNFYRRVMKSYIHNSTTTPKSVSQSTNYLELKHYIELEFYPRTNINKKISAVNKYISVKCS